MLEASQGLISEEFKFVHEGVDLFLAMIDDTLGAHLFLVPFQMTSSQILLLLIHLHTFRVGRRYLIWYNQRWVVLGFKHRSEPLRINWKALEAVRIGHLSCVRRRHELLRLVKLLQVHD